MSTTTTSATTSGSTSGNMTGTPTRRRRIAGERRTSGTTAPPIARPTDPVVPEQPVQPVQPVQPAEPVAEDQAPAPRRNRPGGTGWSVRWQVLAGLAVAAVTAVVLAAGPFVPGVGVAAVADRQEYAATAAARRAAPVAAERAAAAILSYDHRRLELDRDQAAGFMTDAYRRQYLRTFDGAVLEQAEKLDARVVAEVRASAVTLAEPDRAQVLVFVDQTTRSTANEDPQVALNRVMFSMVRQGATWKVDDITSY